MNILRGDWPYMNIKRLFRWNSLASYPIINLVISLGAYSSALFIHALYHFCAISSEPVQLQS